MIDKMLPIELAPTDGTEVIVFAPGVKHNLPDLVSFCSYHPDAGWCIDELREVTHFVYKPKGK